MKRYLYIIFTLIFFTLSTPMMAAQYTLRDLLILAESEATPVTAKLKELRNLTDDLQILQTTYHPKISLNANPLRISPNTRTDETEVDANGTLSGSLTFPFGLEVGGNVKLFQLYDQDNRDYNYSFTLKYDIFPGMKTDATLLQKASKERNIEKALWNLKIAQLDAERTVTQKFYTTLILQEKQKIAEAALNESFADLKLYRDLYNRGDASQSNLIEKELSYQNSKVSFERSHQQYNKSLKELLTYVGIQFSDFSLSIADSIEIIGSIEDVAKINFVLPDQLPVMEELQKQALLNSVDYKEAQLELEVAKDDLSRMKNWPEVKSELLYRSAPNLQEKEEEWAITLSANYAISDGGKQKVERSKQERLIADLSNDLSTAELKVYDELDNMITNLKIAYLEYVSALLDLEKNQLDQQTKAEQFKRDLITLVQFETGERLVRTKELDMFQKQLDYLVSYWNLYQFVYSQSITNEVVQ